MVEVWPSETCAALAALVRLYATMRWYWDACRLGNSELEARKGGLRFNQQRFVPLHDAITIPVARGWPRGTCASLADFVHLDATKKGGQDACRLGHTRPADKDS